MASALVDGLLSKVRFRMISPVHVPVGDNASIREAVNIRGREDRIVSLSYGPLPTRGVLRARFPGGVSYMFDGREFNKIGLCMGGGESSGDRKFSWIVGDYASNLRESEQFIHLAHRLDERPATIIETLEFDRAYPDFKSEKRWIGCIGSYGLEHGIRQAFVLGVEDGKAFIRHENYERWWTQRIGILFVSG